MVGDPKGCRGRAESPPLASLHANFPEGESSLEPDAPTTAQSYGMLLCFGRRSEGVQGASEKPPACVAARQLRRRGILAGGLTRRLRRGWWAAAPRGAVLSFEAKESTKESTRHGDSRGGPPRFASRASACGSPSGCPRPRFASLTRREKALYCSFLKEGVRNVARSIVE